jgi:hypothetical protein
MTRFDECKNNRAFQNQKYPAFNRVGYFFFNSTPKTQKNRWKYWFSNFNYQFYFKTVCPALFWALLL